MRNGFTLTERLYKTDDGKIVKEGDERAAEIYRGPGQEIPLEEAVSLGLIDDEAAESIEASASFEPATASDEVLVDALIGVMTEIKSRDLDLDDGLSEEQRVALAELFSEESEAGGGERGGGDEPPQLPTAEELERDNSRDELNAIAKALGVEDPEKLGNKTAVAEAIAEKQKAVGS